ncbi:MAG: hypothetical protein NTX71_11280 [Candidatus Aureabacteria bacterium]|nr:hypothetical protein [Candidatus Auribacterota bacterium]
MPNIDLKKFSNNLMCRDGIWFSESDGSFSYPKEGHELLFQIEEKSYWFIHRNDCIIEAVKRYPHRGVFFELSGGNGYVSKFIQDHGYDVVLMEPSTTGIENARRRGVDNLICSTFENAHLNGAPRASPWFLHHFGGIRAPTLKLWSAGGRSIPDYAKHAYRQATSGYPLVFIHPA